MIKSVVSFINNVTRRFIVSPVALAQGRNITILQNRLEELYKSQKKAKLEEEAFKVQIANMGKTEAELFTLKRNWLHQTTDMTAMQYNEALERLEDKLEEERQERSREQGHI